MRLSRKAGLVIGLAAVLVVLFASTALATVTIYEGRGVGKARLGLTDTHNKPLLGKVQASWKQTYKTYIVYCYGFGKKLGYHVYAVVMAAKNHKTTEFDCHTNTYVTTKGIKVGSTKAQLVAKYKGLKRYSSGLYWRYTYHYKAYTDFYVRKSTSKVAIIIVRS
jgi:hypothetical protein